MHDRGGHARIPGTPDAASEARPSGAPTPPGQRGARPRRHPIIRGVCLAMWLGVLGVSSGLVAAFLLPLDLHASSTLGLDLAWAAMMARTFWIHILGGLCACFLLAAALRAPRLALVAAGAIGTALLLGGVSPRPGRSMGDAESAAAQDGRPVLKVMTLNLWRGLRDLSRVEALIADERPDIILFQEYTPEHHARLATTASLASDYPWIEAQPARDFSGMATYSRLPLLPESGRLLGARGVRLTDAREWQRQPCCIVRWQGRDVVVQNIHLPTAPMGRTLLRLHHALLAQMRGWLEQETRPVVMGGDFNCTPASAQAALIRGAGAIDAHRAVGAGLGATWGQRLAWPGFRIDHVYTRALRPLAIRVGPDVGSDHRPVLVLLEAAWTHTPVPRP